VTLNYMYIYVHCVQKDQCSHAFLFSNLNEKMFHFILFFSFFVLSALIKKEDCVCVLKINLHTISFFFSIVFHSLTHSAQRSSVEENSMLFFYYNRRFLDSRIVMTLKPKVYQYSNYARMNKIQ
jgi:hypothetical protein